MQKKPLKKEKKYDSDNDSITSSSASEGSTSPQQKRKQKNIGSNTSSPKTDLINRQHKNFGGSLNSSQVHSRSNILSQQQHQQQPQQMNQILSNSIEQKQSQMRMNLLEQQNRQYANKIYSIEQAKHNESKVLKNSISQIQSQLFDIRHRMESLNSKNNQQEDKSQMKQKENSHQKKSNLNQILKNDQNVKGDEGKDTSISSITSSNSDSNSINSSQEDEDVEFDNPKYNNKNQSKRKHKKANRDKGITENIKGYLILNAHKLQHEGKKNLLLKDILNKKIPDQTVISNHLMMERYDIVLRDILDIFLEYLMRVETSHSNTSYLLQTDYHRNHSQKKNNHLDYVKETKLSSNKHSQFSYDWSNKQELRQLSNQDNKSTTRFLNFQNPLNSENYTRYSQNRLTTNESIQNGSQNQLSNTNINSYAFHQQQSQQMAKYYQQHPSLQEAIQSSQQQSNGNPQIQQSPLTTDQSPYRKSYNNDSKIQPFIPSTTPISYQQNQHIINDQLSSLSDNQNIQAQHGRNPSSTKSINSKQISFHNQVAELNEIQKIQLNSGNSRGSIEWFQQQFKPNKKLPIQINIASSSRFNREGSQGILKQNNIGNFINTEDHQFETKGSASTRFSENARKQYQRLNHAISDSQIQEVKQNHLQKEQPLQQLAQQQQQFNPQNEYLQNNQNLNSIALLHSFSNYQNSYSPRNQQQGHPFQKNGNTLLAPQVESLVNSSYQHQLNNTSSLQNNSLSFQYQPKNIANSRNFLSSQELNNTAEYINQIQSMNQSKSQISSNPDNNNNNNSTYNTQNQMLGNISSPPNTIHLSHYPSPNKPQHQVQFTHKYSSSLPFESFMNLNGSTSRNNESIDQNHSRYLYNNSNPSRDYYSPDFKQRMLLSGLHKDRLPLYPEFFQNDAIEGGDVYSNQLVQINNQQSVIEQDIEQQSDQQIPQQTLDNGFNSKSTSIQKNIQQNSQNQIANQDQENDRGDSQQDDRQFQRQKMAHSKSLNLVLSKGKFSTLSPDNTPTSVRSGQVNKKNIPLRLMPCHKYNKSATILIKRKNSDGSLNSNSTQNQGNQSMTSKQQSNSYKCNNCQIIHNREEAKNRFSKLPPCIDQVGRKGRNTPSNNKIKEILSYNSEQQQINSEK